MTQDSDAIIGIYQRHAKAWAEQRRAHRPETVWLDPFLALMPVGGTVLDVGCGSGQPIAQHLIGAGCQITGVDTSVELLNQAQGALPQGKWIAADMRRLDLNQSFDGILAWNSFFHLTQNEQRAMFQVFAKHSHKGTVLMFTSGPELGVAIGTFEGEALYHASLDPAEYTRLLEDVGFKVVRHVADDPACNGQTVWLAQRV